MLNRNSTITFSVHSFSLKKPLRPSPLTGCTCVDVRAADFKCGTPPQLVQWQNEDFPGK